MSKKKETKHKYCKNPECGKKFYRRSRETHYQWGRRKFCKRFCQSKAWALSRGKTRHSDHSYTSMHDHMTALMEKTRKKVDKKVIIYSSTKFSQEELRELIPSEKEGK